MKQKIRVYMVMAFMLSIGIMRSSNVFGQDPGASLSKKEKKALIQENVKTAVEARKYEVRASSATGSKGRTINLTTAYGIKVTPDKISVDLPYYGQSYQSAPYGGDGGIRFESTKFDYETKAGKKDGWEVSAKPNDQDGVQNIFMTISKDGYVSININFTNRTPMRYYGNMLEATVK